MKTAYGYVDDRDQSLCVHIHGQVLSYESPYVVALVLHTNGYWHLDPPPSEEGWPNHIDEAPWLYPTVNEELLLLREAVRERAPGLIEPEHPAETERIAA